MPGNCERLISYASGRHRECETAHYVWVCLYFNALQYAFDDGSNGGHSLSLNVSRTPSPCSSPYNRLWFFSQHSSDKIAPTHLAPGIAAAWHCISHSIADGKHFNLPLSQTLGEAGWWRQCSALQSST